MAEELSKTYEPKSVEQQVNALWSSKPYFHAKPNADGEEGPTFTIVIPPPNVTAPLHLGHALNNTLQDILIRFRRMQGRNTLWMPGTDHAGIATQTVVEKRILSEEGKRRTDFEREEFVARVQAWKDEYEARIIEQLKAMGCSCDWQRTRFTMDEVCARAVRSTFFRLFKDGLIYRGKRLVNWDPATQTVLADDEVEHETVQGHFWYLRYPLVEPVEIDGERIDCVTVATTRPETMLGDTAVAMNPNDPRAKYLVGKKVRLPIVGRLIPIIADEHVVLPDPDSEDEKARFSTGFLKVTPAHDSDDYAIGDRHYEEIAEAAMPDEYEEDPWQYVFLNIMSPDGSISYKHGWADWNNIKNEDVENLIGMDRFKAREAIVEWFRTEKLLEDVREYTHEVGHSYRSHVPIEPYLSDQWYIDVKEQIGHLAEKFGSEYIEGTSIPVNSLAGLALKPLLDGRLRFTPDRYAKTYQTWLENLRNWPISRQLWWGHRIPVWGRSSPITSFEEAELESFEKRLGELRSEGRLWEQRRRTKDFGPEGRQPGLMTSWFICVRDEADEEAREFIEKWGFQRDDDVLDTWFSSALWPFSTLGWPEETPELKTYYPGDVLCTAREIITLWVSRMVMMGQYCVGDIPFSDVYIHAMIQDGQGRKMSKSLGNGIDPLVAIDSHGVDAMRFTLASMTTDTQDIRMPVAEMELPDGRKANTSPKFDIGRNFCNKLWNASRFALMNLEGMDPAAFDAGRMDITDRWILSRLAQTISEVTESLENFRYSEPLAALYRFFWNDLCDWYLEWAKPRMQDEQTKPIAQNVLAFALDRVLRLLHPFVPMITEGIFQKLNEISPLRQLRDLIEGQEAEALAIAKWPERLDHLVDVDAEKQIELVQSVIRAVRDIRSKYNKPPNEMFFVSTRQMRREDVETLNQNADLIRNLAGVRDFEAGIAVQKPEKAAVALADSTEVYVHDMVDPEAERQRFEKQKEQIEKARNAVEAKLANENFVNKAKPEVVDQARDKLAQLTEQLKTIDKHLSELDNG